MNCIARRDKYEKRYEQNDEEEGHIEQNIHLIFLYS